MCIYFYAVFPQTSFTNIRLDVPDLDSDNYKVWRERILLQLGYTDIDYVIRKDKPILTEPSTLAQVALHEPCERSNRLSVIFIKTKISASIRGSVE